MAQPASLYLSRQLVRVMPFATQKTFVTGAAGGGAQFVAEFDVAQVVTDANQLLAGAAPIGTLVGIQFAIGPFLDAVIFDNGAGGATITVNYAVDKGATYRLFNTTVVPASTLTNIAGLRVTARFVQVIFTNITPAATLEAGVWLRSS
jgi:hypothetical protein